MAPTARKARIPVENRGKIVAMVEMGVSYREVAARLGSTPESDMQPYQQRKSELSVHCGCLLWGSRVIIPPTATDRVMTQLYVGHPGISRMKSLARSYVWWPNITADLEQKSARMPGVPREPETPPDSPPTSMELG